jgi:hypothetical protein
MGLLVLILVVYVVGVSLFWWLKKTESGNTVALFALAGVVMLVAKCSGL